MNQKFHERFAIKIDRKEAEKRFVNRAYNNVFQGLNKDMRKEIASALGEKFYDVDYIDEYIKGDFYRTLQGLEAVYAACAAYEKPEVDLLIINIVLESEFDLGIRWEDGQFVPSGAKVLDDKLVDESLKWLSDIKYETVLNPFSKGLEHFLHAGKRPELLSDVITDMYEALEALAKIITGRDKDLSANAELLIKKLGVSVSYRRILKDYIFYSNEFRHAQKEGRKKPKLSMPEVESFIYLTGLFIRLASQIEIKNE